MRRAGPVHRRPEAHAEGVGELHDGLDVRRGIAATVVPAGHGGDRHQQLLGEVVGLALAGVALPPVDVLVDNAAVPERHVAQGMGQREALQHHRARRVDEDEGDALAYGAPTDRGLPVETGHDHLDTGDVLEERDEVGHGAVGIDVELLAPEPRDAVSRRAPGPGLAHERGRSCPGARRAW